MSVLRGLFERRSDAYPAVDSPYSEGRWDQGMVFQPWGRGSGARPVEAMRLSAVFGCLRILSESIATLPIDCYRRRGARRIEMDTPSWLRFDAMAESYSEIDYLSQLVLSLLTDGNAYIATARDAMGVPTSLTVLDPCKITPRRESNGHIVFDFDGDTFDHMDVLHVRGMTMPGAIRGLSPIAYAREVVDLGLSAQRFGSSFFDNGALPGAVLEVPGEMKQETAERFKATWNGRHGGVGNANRVGVLTNGAKISKVTWRPNDAQFLESRQFSVPDVCRFYGVPPHLVADASNSTSWGCGLAEQNLAFGQFASGPWVTRIDRAHTRLLSSAGRAAPTSSSTSTPCCGPR